MASAGVAASQSSRKWAAWRFDHAQRAGCWTSELCLRVVERRRGVFEPPTGGLRETHETRSCSRSSACVAKSEGARRAACLFAPQ